MRIGKNKSTTRESCFNVDKDVDSKMDVVEAKFVRRLTKGLGKYKGKMPFKCCKCGKIGHFSSKCPLKNKRKTSNDDEVYSFNKRNPVCK